MLQTLMRTAAKGNVCCVTDAVLGAVTTEPTQSPAAVGCCTTTLPTGCAVTEAPRWTDEDDVISTGTDAADEGSTGGRTDIGGGGRTPSMCILFMLNECRSNGKLFYNNIHQNKFTTVANDLGSSKNTGACIHQQQT